MKLITVEAMERAQDWSEDDPIAAAYFSLPEIGLPPRPDLEGLLPQVAEALVVVAPNAWRMAGDTLGTDFAMEAFELAERLARLAPDLLCGDAPLVWARRIAWTIADRHDLIGNVCGLAAPDLAAELDSNPRHLRIAAAAIKEALADDKPAS